MRRLLVTAIVLLAVTGVTLAGYVASRPDTTAPAPTPGRPASPLPGLVASSSPASVVKTTTGIPHLAHVFVIVMENKAASEILHNSSAPYINGLARRYGLATDYSAITHPSLPNYIALTSGSTQGITDDRSPPGAGYAVDAVNLADRLESAHLTWKAYAESLPSPGYADNAGQFVTKHEPFLYYNDILKDPARRAEHIVPFTQLRTDLAAAGTTPAFAFITPNMCSDMHDCPVSEGDRWLARTVPVILTSAAFRSTPSLLVVTWDEGSGADNHVVTIFAGNSVQPHVTSSRAYSHYSLLHTIEAALQLHPLTGNDGGAPVMSPFFKP